MEKKKLKLSISGSSKKTFSSIEEAKSKSKNTVVIEKKNSKFSGKSHFSRQSNNNFRTSNNNSSKLNNFSRQSPQPSSDFEKRKLAEQRATKRLKDEGSLKDKKVKLGAKKREVKLTVSRALSDEIEARERSLASVKRAREKENKHLKSLNFYLLSFDYFINFFSTL